jgi:hypothetical protein
VPQFYRVRIDMAFFSPRAANAVLGTAQILGGLSNPGALAIAEVMAPDADNAIFFAGDKEPELLTSLVICQTCFLDGPLDLVMLMEQINQRRERDASESSEPDRR